MPTEHQYFVTETIPQIAAMDRRLPSVADRDGVKYYLRQEGQGLLVGAYERDMRYLGRGGHAAKASATSCSPMTSSGSRRT